MLIFHYRNNAITTNRSVFLTKYLFRPESPAHINNNNHYYENSKTKTKTKTEKPQKRKQTLNRMRELRGLV